MCNLSKGAGRGDELRMDFVFVYIGNKIIHRIYMRSKTSCGMEIERWKFQNQSIKYFEKVNKTGK